MLWNRTLVVGAVVAICSNTMARLTFCGDATTGQTAVPLPKVPEFLGRMVGQYDVVVDPRSARRDFESATATIAVEMNETALVVRLTSDAYCSNWTLRFDDKGKAVKCWWLDTRHDEMAKLAGEIKSRDVTFTGMVGEATTSISLLPTEDGLNVSVLEGFRESAKLYFRKHLGPRSDTGR